MNETGEFLKSANLSLINARLYLPDTEKSLRHLRAAIQKMKTAKNIIASEKK